MEHLPGDVTTCRRRQESDRFCNVRWLQQNAHGVSDHGIANGAVRAVLTAIHGGGHAGVREPGSDNVGSHAPSSTGAGTAQKTAAPSDSCPEPNSARSNAFLMKFCQGGAAENRLIMARMMSPASAAWSISLSSGLRAASRPFSHEKISTSSDALFVQALAGVASDLSRNR